MYTSKRGQERSSPMSGRGKVGATLRELGYPSRVQLVAWYKEWEAGKGSLAEALRCKALSLP